MTRPNRSLGSGALLTALVALGQISTSIYIPSMPSLAMALDARPDQIHATFSLFLFGFAVCQLVFGPLSDHFGRRPVMLWGLLLYMLASLACALAVTINQLIVGRLAQGMAAGSGPVLGRAMVRDLYGPVGAARAMAYISVAMAVSPAVAPIIGGYLQIWFGWRAAFVFLTLVGCVMVLGALRYLPETRRPDPQTPPSSAGLLRSYGKLMQDRRYWGYTLVVTFVFSGLMIYTSSSPFVFIDLIGLTPEHFGMLAVFPVTGFLIGSLAAGRLTTRFGIDPLVWAGVLLCFAGGTAMAAFASAQIVAIIAIVGPMMVFTAGLGMAMAMGMAGAMADYPEHAGAASALLGFVQMAAAALISLGVGALPATSPCPMAWGIALTAAGALVGAALLKRRRAPTDPST